MLAIPTQELYDKIFEVSQSLGFDTYDYLPAKEVEYPFIQLANTQQTTLNLKTAKGGLISQTIHVWGTLKMRYQVTQIMEQLNQLSDRTLITDNFRFVGRNNQSDFQIMNDTSVPDTVLVHGVLTLFFNLG